MRAVTQRGAHKVVWVAVCKDSEEGSGCTGPGVGFC